MRLYPFVLVAALATGGLLQAQGVVEVGLAPESGLEKADRLAGEGRIDDALALYRELSADRVASGELHTRIGGMLLMKQDYSEAIGQFQSAIGLDDGRNSEAFIGLGIAYLHLGQYGLARAALDEARRLKPESAADLNHLVAWLDGRTDGRTPGAQAKHH